jgi:hypothetical protein
MTKAALAIGIREFAFMCISDRAAEIAALRRS